MKKIKCLLSCLPQQLDASKEDKKLWEEEKKGNTFLSSGKVQ